MPRRLTLSLIPCVAVFMLLAVTTSNSPRRSASKSAVSGPRTTSDTAPSAERSGYIVASS